MACSTCIGCNNATCTTGFYGAECNLTCSPSCRSLPCAGCTCDVCDVTSGYCINGCDFGWYGDTCQHVCSDTCERSYTISAQALPEVCERTSGYCIHGCESGYYGNTCNLTCQAECTTSTCDIKTGLCPTDAGNGLGRSEIAGAAGGAFVVVLWSIVVLIIIYVIKRRRQHRYDTFSRDKILTPRPSRGSSRRCLRHESQSSAIEVVVPDNYETYGVDELCDAATVSSPASSRSGRPPRIKRTVTFEEDSPTHIGLSPYHSVCPGTSRTCRHDCDTRECDCDCLDNQEIYLFDDGTYAKVGGSDDDYDAHAQPERQKLRRSKSLSIEFEQEDFTVCRSNEQ